MMALVALLIVLAGLAAMPVLFHRFPRLPVFDDETDDYPSVSVVIPARDEEENLSHLLSDLRAQTFSVEEVICVDDASEDATREVARTGGAHLISLCDKPQGWTGKTWACQHGADAAKGDLLLFLDADVRLGPEGVRALVHAYQCSGGTVSVQPYHRTERPYEQLSMMFNLVQIAANGSALPNPIDIGLYGPVILISQGDYARAGGHAQVRGSIVEDMALGSRLRELGLPFTLYLGDGDISFRMYGGGLRVLLQGWVKNMAAGAAKTPIPVFALVVLWVASLISAPFQAFGYGLQMDWPWMALYSTVSIVWVIVMASLAKRVGRFSPWASVLYLVPVLTFVGVVAVSVFRKVLHRGVVWKGRTIGAEERPCG